MATEAKPFASLSSGLLARKGAARPAMRPQGFGQVGSGLEDLGWNDMGFEPPKPAEVARDVDHDAFGEDVVEHPRAHPTGLTPVHSPVHDQQAEIVERLNGADDAERGIRRDRRDRRGGGPKTAPRDCRARRAESPTPVASSSRSRAPTVVPAPAPRRAPRPRAAPGSKAQGGVHAPPRPDRHLKLRLACAVDGRSAQQLVTDALDQLLERMPELDGLAEKAKRRG